jgi:integrase
MAGRERGVVTVGQWLTAWLDARITVRASTRANYASSVGCHLRPHLGRIPLVELSARDVEVMLARIVRADAGSGPASMATLHRVLSCLRTALNAAVREGLLSSNPALQVRLARSRRPSAVVWTADRVEVWRRTGWRPAVAVWTAPQTAQFLTFIRDHRLYAAFHLIALRGLRRGEAAGLRWADLDLPNKTALISFQNQRRDGHLAICPPKTPSGVRPLALDFTTVAVLQAHRATQQVELRRLGVEDSGYVFTDERGRPLAPSYLTDLFRKLVRDSGLPPIRLHDLRHGAASLALQAGVGLKVVCDQFGHTSIVLTADSYTSVLPHTAHEAAEAVAQLIRAHGALVPGTRRKRRSTGIRARVAVHAS